MYNTTRRRNSLCHVKTINTLYLLSQPLQITGNCETLKPGRNEKRLLLWDPLKTPALGFCRACEGKIPSTAAFLTERKRVPEAVTFFSFHPQLQSFAITVRPTNTKTGSPPFTDAPRQSLHVNFRRHAKQFLILFQNRRNDLLQKLLHLDGRPSHIFCRIHGLFQFL